MGICIEIKKIDSINNIYFYAVNTSDFGGAQFTISINAATNELVFYGDVKHAELIYSLQEKIWVQGDPQKSPTINSRVVPYVILRAQKAMTKNLFPQHIGYAA